MDTRKVAAQTKQMQDFIAGIKREHKSRLTACDSLAKPPAIAQEKAICRNRKLELELRTVSMNDILESFEATRLLDDPNFRDKLLRASSTLNTRLKEV